MHGADYSINCHDFVQAFSFILAEGFTIQKSSILGHPPGHPLLAYLQRLLPGIVLCSAITIAAIMVESVEVYFAGTAYLESLVIAILLGVLVRTIWRPGAKWIPGIAFSAKFVLECAIVMLGALVSAATVFSLGFELILGIVLVVSLTIGGSYVVCRLLGLTQTQSILIACGNSICGNSAIAAIAPVIGADGDEIASSISFTAALGVLVVLGLPLLVPILHLSLTQYGILAGLTVYAVPQVVAATVPVGALSNQVGTLIKLVRVLMLGPVVLCLSLFAGRLRPGDNRPRCVPQLREMVPWFIAGFVILIAIRSLGLIPQTVLPAVTHAATVLTNIAMVGLGLGVELRAIARSGARVTVAVTASLIVLGTMSYALIFVVGVTGQ